MTNKHEALKIMSYIIGSIERWLQKYKKSYHENEILEIVYILFNPKSEESEVGDIDNAGINKRDRLYRMYLQKFAKNYDSTVKFSQKGGIAAEFNPHILIK